MQNKRKLKYKGITVNAFGFPVKVITKHKKSATKQRIRANYNTSFDFEYPKNSPKTLIVMYDIPHNLKKERDWLRRHLIKFEYVMIQKSVWVGPSPLPKDFLDYLKKINIGDKLKTFKLAKQIKF